MYFEAEVYSLLVIGFGAVMLAEAFFLAKLYKRTHSSKVGWFAGQMVSLAAAFYFFFQCVTTFPEPSFTMYSEEQSVRIAMAGIFWAGSMFMKLIGLHGMLSEKEKQ